MNTLLSGYAKYYYISMTTVGREVHITRDYLSHIRDSRSYNSGTLALPGFPFVLSLARILLASSTDCSSGQRSQGYLDTRDQ